MLLGDMFLNFLARFVCMDFFPRGTRFMMKRKNSVVWKCYLIFSSKIAVLRCTFRNFERYTDQYLCYLFTVIVKFRILY